MYEYHSYNDLMEFLEFIEKELETMYIQSLQLNVNNKYNEKIQKIFILLKLVKKKYNIE